MGWSAGKGLGRNEDGMRDHIKVSYNFDNKGLGFDERTAVYDFGNEYNDLLSKLSQTYSNGNKESGSEGEKPAEPGVKPKTRHRYHKIRRAKDVQGYSEKDLNSIFALTQKQTKGPTAEPNGLNQSTDYPLIDFGIKTSFSFNDEASDSKPSNDSGSDGPQSLDSEEKSVHVQEIKSEKREKKGKKRKGKREADEGEIPVVVEEKEPEEGSFSQKKKKKKRQRKDKEEEASNNSSTLGLSSQGDGDENGTKDEDGDGDGDGEGNGGEINKKRKSRAEKGPKNKGSDDEKKKKKKKKEDGNEKGTLLEVEGNPREKRNKKKIKKEKNIEKGKDMEEDAEKMREEKGVEEEMVTDRGGEGEEMGVEMEREGEESEKKRRKKRKGEKRIKYEEEEEGVKVTEKSREGLEARNGGEPTGEKSPEQEQEQSEPKVKVEIKDKVQVKKGEEEEEVKVSKSQSKAQGAVVGPNVIPRIRGGYRLNQRVCDALLRRGEIKEGIGRHEALASSNLLCIKGYGSDATNK
jgi:hypothetical protein